MVSTPTSGGNKGAPRSVGIRGCNSFELYLGGIPIYKSSVHVYEGTPMNLHFPLLVGRGYPQAIPTYNSYNSLIQFLWFTGVRISHLQPSRPTKLNCMGVFPALFPPPFFKSNFHFVEYFLGVSLNGGFSQNTAKWSFLGTGKPMVVGVSPTILGFTSI